MANKAFGIFSPNAKRGKGIFDDFVEIKTDYIVIKSDHIDIESVIDYFSSSARTKIKKLEFS